MDNRDQNKNDQQKREQSTILWILLSALTVIAIVIAAGLFFFFPSEGGSTPRPRLSSTSTKDTGRDFDQVQYVNGDGYPAMTKPAETTGEFSVGGSDTKNQTAETAPAEGTAAEKQTTDAAETANTNTGDEVSNVKEIKAPAPAPAPEPKKTTTVKKAPETRKVSVTVYWIQVGSYTDLTKAEEVRSYLQTKQISSEIQTRAVDGKTYYRVRIGAFQSKGEADKFLEPIKNMKNFDESYVVQTTMIREVPVN